MHRVTRSLDKEYYYNRNEVFKDLLDEKLLQPKPNADMQDLVSKMDTIDALIERQSMSSAVLKSIYDFDDSNMTLFNR